MTKLKGLLFALFLGASMLPAQISTGVFVPPTRRFAKGSSLPSTCQVGDVFFKSAATIGQYNCNVTDTWTAVGTGTGSVTSVQVLGTANQITATSCGPSTTTLTCTLSFPSAVQMTTLALNGATIGSNALAVVGTTALNCTSIGEFCVGSTATSAPRGITSGQFSTSTDSARFNGYKARGTQATPTTVVTADFLTRWSGYGYDSANYIESASVVMGTEGTIAATRVPSFISIQTSTDATPSVLTERMRIKSSGSINMGSALPLGWTSTGDSSGTCDTALSRISAGLIGVGTCAAGSVAGSLSMTNATLAGSLIFPGGAGFLVSGTNLFEQRNGTSAQAFNVYNTYTDGSNYELGGLLWSGNNFILRTGNSGTGQKRSIVTQTNGSNRWYMPDFDGNILAVTDNTLDIGASGANRPRSIYVGTNGTFGGVLAVSGAINGSGSVQAGSASAFFWGSRMVMRSPADGTITLNNNAESAGVRLDVTTNGTLKVQASAGGDTAILAVNKGNFGWSGFGTASQSTSSVLDTSGRVYMASLTASAGLQTGVLCIGASNEVINDSVACLASTAKEKHDIQDINLGLSTVMALRPITFHYNLTGNAAFDGDISRSMEQLGFTAEQAASVDPRLAGYAADGSPRTFRYENYTAVLTKAIQEQQAQIDALKAEVAKLQPGRMAF